MVALISLLEEDETLDFDELGDEKDDDDSDEVIKTVDNEVDDSDETLDCEELSAIKILPFGNII